MGGIDWPVLYQKSSRQIGTVYEKKAAMFLAKQGYQILEKNFRCRQGELDLIARQGRYLVFVEVKYRQNKRSGFPEEAVGFRKQQRIIAAAKYYMYRRNMPEDTPCRFDIVGICGEETYVIKNAFEYNR